MARDSTTYYRVEGLSLIRRGERYHIRGTHEGKAIRITTKTDNLAKAKHRLDEFVRELDSGWRLLPQDSDRARRRLAVTAYTKCRTQARAREIPFHLKPSHVYDLMVQTNFRCAVSGIEFSREPVAPGVADPWAASIDRIENRHGYTPENIRVVCVLANMAMNRWGYDALLRLSKAVVFNANQVAAEPRLTTAHDEHIDCAESDDNSLNDNEKAA